MRYMKSGRARSKESGYVLLALMLTLTLMLIALSVEAPRIAQQIKRDKEEELIHRGKDYATAVKRFVHKNGGRYPVSIEQLENTNHIRFLRKKYVDPMTGESDWKMVHVGEAEINIPAPNPGLSGGGGKIRDWAAAHRAPTQIRRRYSAHRPGPDAKPANRPAAKSDWRHRTARYTEHHRHWQWPDRRRWSDHGRGQCQQETCDQRIQRQRRIRPVVLRL